jgi:outer membrane protein
MGQNKVGLSFSLPLYQGGQVNSQVKQAQYNFVARASSWKAHTATWCRPCVPSFNNVNASISSINAYKQAVVSAQSSWMRWKQVTRWVHVPSLTCWTRPPRCTTQNSSSPARYTYLINQLNIKQALGTLNEQDLQMLNSTGQTGFDIAR